LQTHECGKHDHVLELFLFRDRLVLEIRKTLSTSSEGESTKNFSDAVDGRGQYKFDYSPEQIARVQAVLLLDCFLDCGALWRTPSLMSSSCALDLPSPSWLRVFFLSTYIGSLLI